MAFYTIEDRLLIYLDSEYKRDPARWIFFDDLMNQYRFFKYGDSAHTSTRRSYHTYQASIDGSPEIDRNELLNAIKKLIGDGYVKTAEEGFTYQITGRGSNKVDDLRHPELTPDYQHKRDSDRNFSIGIVSVLIALVSLLVYLYQGKPKESLPVPPVERYWTPINLLNAVDQNNQALWTQTLGDIFSDPPTNPHIDGIQYSLNFASPVIESESRHSKNPNRIIIPIGLRGLKRLHFLINLCYGAQDYVGQNLEGVEIARIWWYFDGREAGYSSLKIGQQIREWAIGHPGSVVLNTDQNVKEIFRSTVHDSSTEAVIDHIPVDLPIGYSDDRLNYVIIEDLSSYVFNSVNPGLMIFGLTVEQNH